jgi:hypothetical protein
MSMRKVGIKELSQDVQSFIAQVGPGEGIVIEDETGRAMVGITPYVEATATERAAAWKLLEGLQEKASQAMKEQGVTETDVMKLLLEDD